MKTPGPSAVLAADVVSEPLVYPSRSGLKVAAYWDHRQADFEGCPFVIMAPKYGETKKNNLQLAYQLAANGLNVLRFDHTCHVGESGGDRLRFTLQTAVEDILASIDYLHEHHGATTVGLVGSSLSSRMALRAASLDRRVGFFVSIVGVVNFRRTITAVNGEDTLGHFLAGRKRGIGDVLGIEVHFESFLEAVFANGFEDLAGTVADARRLRCPSAFFAAGKDAWVDVEDVREVVQVVPGAQLHLFDQAMHEVRENAQVSEALFRSIVGTCVQFAYESREPPESILSASKAALLRQNRAERMRLRAAIEVESDETVFWGQYLRKFDYIQNGDVYRRYLDLVVDLMGDVPAGGVVLDAGCGNGFAGVCYQKRAAASRSGDTVAMPMWLSVDLTSSGLGDAMRNHFTSLTEACEEDGTLPSLPLDFGYCVADLDAAKGGSAGRLGWLQDATVDTVVASLMLSYLAEPETILREFHRLLKPGGRLVISSMKPNCDLSLVYRSFVEQEEDPDKLEPARDLLRAAGAIRLKEELGYYRFFGGEDLEALLGAAGFRHPMVFMSLADQAVVVRAEK